MWWLPHKPPADCESHIQQSQLSARQAGRQAGRTFLLPPLFLSLFSFCCIYPSVSLYPLSPPAWRLGVIHLKYLSCPSKNDLEGRAKSIFSESGHGQTIVGDTGHQSLQGFALCSAVRACTLFYRAKYPVHPWWSIFFSNIDLFHLSDLGNMFELKGDLEGFIRVCILTLNYARTLFLMRNASDAI